MLIYLQAVYDGFYVTKAELSHSGSDHMCSQSQKYFTIWLYTGKAYGPRSSPEAFELFGHVLLLENNNNSSFSLHVCVCVY